MKKLSRSTSSDMTRLRLGASVIALGVMAAGIAGSAFAQTTPASTDTTAASDTKSTEVVVVGVRRSLKTSQQIKKDADTVVDSITATDIGAFPDKSVAEALQRVAGITVSRFAATSDTAHFSAEPSGVLVRGLTQVRSEFNSRDTFSANSSRGLSWGDVSPELMAGVDSYKNETADMIEGGIAGTIDLRTRLPFDTKGQVIAVSADLSYNENGNKTTPDISGIYTNRWDTSIGEFGLMVNGAASDVQTRSEGVQEGRDAVFDGSLYGQSGNVYIPTTVAYHDNAYTRNRTGIAAAGQWQNHDHSMVATLQYNQTSYDNSWKENIVTGDFFSTYGSGVNTVYSSPYSLEPATGTSDFTFDSNGMFLTGTPSGDYYNQTGTVGTSSRTEIAGCSNWSGSGLPDEASCGRLGSGLTTSTRYADTKEQTQDVSFNFKWDVNDHIKTNFDVQYVTSTVHGYDMTADLETYQNITLNLSGKYPTMTFSSPENVSLTSGGLTDPNNYRYNDLMDHTEDDKGHELATRFDVQYAFGNDGWLSSLKAGVRYADREQQIMWSNYNWGGMQSVWSGVSDNAFITGAAYPQDVYGVQSFGSKLLGGGLLSSNDFVFINMNAIKDRTDFANALTNTTGVDGNNNGGSWTALCNRTGLVDGTCYQQSEINNLSEKTMAAYAMLKFGGKDKVIFGNVTLDGNIGVRWVQTEDISRGYVEYPTASSWAGTLTCDTTQDAYSPGCLKTSSTATNLANAIAFSTGGGTALTSDTTHINTLPSLNLKFGLTDKWIVRFAASEGMSRPDLGLLKNYVSISNPTVDTSTTCATSQTCTVDSNGHVTDYSPTFTASAGNAKLKSTTADQFDLTAEDYFASDGYFSFDIFYKKFHNYITTGKYLAAYTSGGVTEDVVVTGPVNGDGASVKGFEVAYQRFFDFLPGAWSGLGIQANYTHLSNTGVSNANLTDVSGSGSTTPTSSSSGLAQDVDSINPHALEGMSNDSYNLIAMYEKGPWAARLAYNWRSMYLVSSLDCCVGLPIWQKAQGLLDGSIRYKVNDQIELSLEGTNLLGSDTVLMQQVAGDTTATPNAARVLMPDAWYKNDRRFQFGIRLKY